MAFQVVDKTYIGRRIGNKKLVSDLIKKYGWKAEYCGKRKIMFIVYNRTLIKARQKQGNYYNDDPVCLLQSEELYDLIVNTYFILSFTIEPTWI